MGSSGIGTAFDFNQAVATEGKQSIPKKGVARHDTTAAIERSNNKKESSNFKIMPNNNAALRLAHL